MLLKLILYTLFVLEAITITAFAQESNKEMVDLFNTKYRNEFSPMWSPTGHFLRTIRLGAIPMWWANKLSTSESSLPNYIRLARKGHGLINSKKSQDKKSAHLIRMIRKDEGFSSKFSPYFPMPHNYASSLGRMVNTGGLGNHEALEDVTFDNDFSNRKFSYGKQSLQDNLTRKWIKLLGLAMYFKNE